MTNLTKAKILWWTITFFYLVPAFVLAAIALVPSRKLNDWVKSISFKLTAFRREKCFDVARGYTLTIED